MLEVTVAMLAEHGTVLNIPGLYNENWFRRSIVCSPHFTRTRKHDILSSSWQSCGRVVTGPRQPPRELAPPKAGGPGAPSSASSLLQNTHT